MLKLGISEQTRDGDLKQSGWFHVKHQGQLLRVRFQWSRHGGSNPSVIFDGPLDFDIRRPSK